MIEDLLFVPLVLFLIFVAPLWLVLHYRDKRRREELARRLGDEENLDLQRYARELEERVRALETILDQEAPGWRDHA